MRHTRGPWLAAEAVSSRVGLPVVKAGAHGGQLICNVNCASDPIHGKVAGDDAFNREALANARLIAAAPDLLAALQSLRAFVGVRFGNGPDAVIPEAMTIEAPLGVPIKIGQIMRDVAAAIAKAEGRP